MNNDIVDLCNKDPGKDVDVYVSSSVRCLVNVWSGDLNIQSEFSQGSIKAQGLKHLIRTMPDWLGASLYKDILRGDTELTRQTTKQT